MKRILVLSAMIGILSVAANAGIVRLAAKGTAKTAVFGAHVAKKTVKTAVKILF